MMLSVQLNIEPNHTTLAGHNYAHDLLMSSVSGMLGSVDANTGDPMLGWDTDQFPMDIKDATLAMQVQDHPLVTLVHDTSLNTCSGFRRRCT